MPAPWARCQCCENYWCNIHGQHAHDCPCPPIEEWATDPYEDQADEKDFQKFESPQVDSLDVE